MSTVFVTTPRLVLRELTFDDADALLEMDADPEVQRFVGGVPKERREQAVADVEIIRAQYEKNGIGRWAAVLRETNEWIDWAGIKLFREPMLGRSRFYELGYRFKRAHWGKGLATEAALACRDYARDVLRATELFAFTEPDHVVSQKVFTRCGFVAIGEHEHWGRPHTLLRVELAQTR